MWDSRREFVAEAIGTAFLLAAVVGSGVMADRLTDDAGLRLLIAALVTGFVLAVLISAFIGISGAHFNPVVTLGAWRLGLLEAFKVVPYIAAQLVGGLTGVVLANVMFEESLLSIAQTDRWGGGAAAGEIVATLGLVLLIFVLVRQDKFAAIGPGVGAYIAAAYFFTSSTSFANPAVTISRIFTDTPAGIAPASAPGFIVMQLVGAAVAVFLVAVVTPASD